MSNTGQRFRWFDLLFLVALAAYIVAGVPATPFHADEATQIHMSRDFAYQFLQGDYARLRYDPDAELTAETQLRLINGTLPKYLMGLSWWLAGYTTDDLNQDWDWAGDWSYNASTGRLPSEGVLNASRIPSALMLAAGVFVVFALGWRMGGRFTAYGACLFYALHPALLINGRRAMMEAALTFFSLLTVLAGVLFAERRSWRTAALLGLSAGLTITSKHTGAAVVASVFAAVGLYLIAKTVYERFVPTASTASTPVPALGTAFLRLVTAGVLVLAVFFVLNPAWWGGDPVGIAQDILDWRAELLSGQTQDHGGYADRLAQMQGFVRMVFQASPQYYEVGLWSDYPEINAQIAGYETTPWTGIPWDSTPAIGIGLLLLTAIGIFALLRDPDLDNATRAVVGIWAAAMLVVTFLSPLAWQRYYLPVYPAVGLLAAYAPIGLIRWLRLIAQQRAERARERAAQPSV